jgi:hypothetical protein
MAASTPPMSGTPASTVPRSSKLTLSGAAKGITAESSSAGMKAKAGASRNSPPLAAAGRVSSFRMFLSPSATGWSRPAQPTRFGPCRFCIHADTFRSMSVSSATPTSTTVNTTSILRTLNSRKPFISGLIARPPPARRRGAPAR